MTDCLSENDGSVVAKGRTRKNALNNLLKECDWIYEEDEERVVEWDNDYVYIDGDISFKFQKI